MHLCEGFETWLILICTSELRILTTTRRIGIDFSVTFARVKGRLLDGSVYFGPLMAHYFQHCRQVCLSSLDVFEGRKGMPHERHLPYFG